MATTCQAPPGFVVPRGRRACRSPRSLKTAALYGVQSTRVTHTRRQAVLAASSPKYSVCSTVDAPIKGQVSRCARAGRRRRSHLGISAASIPRYVAALLHRASGDQLPGVRRHRVVAGGGRPGMATFADSADRTAWASASSEIDARERSSARRGGPTRRTSAVIATVVEIFARIRTSSTNANGGAGHDFRRHRTARAGRRRTSSRATTTRRPAEHRKLGWWNPPRTVQGEGLRWASTVGLPPRVYGIRSPPGLGVASRRVRPSTPSGWQRPSHLLEECAEDFYDPPAGIACSCPVKSWAWSGRARYDGVIARARGDHRFIQSSGAAA